MGNKPKGAMSKEEEFLLSQKMNAGLLNICSFSGKQSDAIIDGTQASPLQIFKRTKTKFLESLCIIFYAFCLLHVSNVQNIPNPYTFRMSSMEPFCA